MHAGFSLFGHESGLTSVVTPSLSVCLCHCLSAGVISCKIHTLDRETKSQYVVVVKAQDMRGMASGSTATTSVSITITDTNDNRASFIRSKEQSADVNVKTNRATFGNILKGAFLGTLQWLLSVRRVIRTAGSRRPQGEWENRLSGVGGQRSDSEQGTNLHHPKWHQQRFQYWTQP